MSHFVLYNSNRQVQELPQIPPPIHGVRIKEKEDILLVYMANQFRILLCT